jgi:integrase
MRDDERLFKVGRTWHTWVYVAGKRCKRTTRCRSKAAARIVAKQLEEAAADPDRAATQATTIDDALSAVLLLRREQAKAGQRSKDTAEFYLKKSMQILRVLGRELLLATLTDSRPLDAYVSIRRREIATPTMDHTIYKELTVIRAALKLAKRQGLWRGDVEAVVPHLSPRYQPTKKWYSPDQLDKLLAELEADDAARAAFVVATSAELRATKLAERADVGQHLVEVRGTKRTSRRRTVPIVTDWQRSLIVYALEHARGAGPLLFKRSDEEFRGALRYAARRAGLPHVTPNDLRRTYSTWLRAAGARSENVWPTMGHTDGRMLERTYDGTSPAILAALLSVDMGLDTVWTERSKSTATDETNATASPSEKVPGTGIEPVTRGFSVPARIWHLPRPHAALNAIARRGWTRFGQRRAN